MKLEFFLTPRGKPRDHLQMMFAGGKSLKLFVKISQNFPKRFSENLETTTQESGRLTVDILALKHRSSEVQHLSSTSLVNQSPNRGHCSFYAHSPHLPSPPQKPSINISGKEFSSHLPPLQKESCVIFNLGKFLNINPRIRKTQTGDGEKGRERTKRP